MRKVLIIGGVVIIVCAIFLGLLFSRELIAMRDKIKGATSNMSNLTIEVVDTIDKGEEQRVILGVINRKYEDGTALVTIGNENLTCTADPWSVLEEYSEGDKVYVHVYKYMEDGVSVNKYYIEE